MLSLSTPEYAVRRMVRAISSAIDKSVFLNSSKPMGSRGLVVMVGLSRDPRSDLPGQLDDDVAGGVERRSRARRHHARRVVLLHDAGADARLGQVGTVEDRRLAPAEVAEVDAPARWAATGPRSVQAKPL